nr:hypothetical protein CFP56_19753 [Quercus suber]
MGGPKALPYKAKLGSVIHPSRSFVDTVKAPLQVRKQLHQPSIRETEEIQVVENTTPPPRDIAGNQVVALEVPTNIAIPIAMGGVEGSHRDTNGVAKSKEKIPEQNKFKLHNLNLNDVGSGREHQIRRSSWLGKGLIVEVNEFGKRRVFWQHYRGDKQTVKWVAREVNSAQDVFKGMDTGFLNPMHLGACSKQTQNKPSPSITCLSIEDGVLESSTSGLSLVSNGESATVVPVSSMLLSLPPRRPAMASMVTLGSNSSLSAPKIPSESESSIQVPSWATQSPTLPIVTSEVTQAACELGSPNLAPICPSLEPAELTVLSSRDPIVKLVEKSSSLAATKDEDDKLLGPEMVILSLIVKRTRVKALVKDKQTALEAFGTYVEIDYGLWCCMQSMVGDASDKKFLKKALRGVRTIICPNEGFLSNVEGLKGVQHVVLLSQLSAYRGSGGIQALMKSNARKLAEQDESLLMASGIPYTIIRAGLLQSTPGGQQGFCFEEGSAARGNLSKEDAAFICVQALDAVPQIGFIFEVVNGDEKISDWQECMARLMEKAGQQLQ